MPDSQEELGNPEGCIHRKLMGDLSDLRATSNELGAARAMLKELEAKKGRDVAFIKGKMNVCVTLGLDEKFPKAFGEAISSFEEEYL